MGKKSCFFVKTNVGIGLFFLLESVCLVYEDPLHDGVQQLVLYELGVAFNVERGDVVVVINWGSIKRNVLLKLSRKKIRNHIITRVDVGSLVAVGSEEDGEIPADWINYNIPT